MAKVHKECENSLWIFLIYFINCKFVEWALLPLYIYTSSHSPQTHPLLDAASRDLPDIVVKRPTGVAEKEEHAALTFTPFQPVTSYNRLVAFLFLRLHAVSCHFGLRSIAHGHSSPTPLHSTYRWWGLRAEGEDIWWKCGVGILGEIEGGEARFGGFGGEMGTGGKAVSEGRRGRWACIGLRF